MSANRTTSESADLNWYKSSHSGPDGGDCVEVAKAPDVIHIRDSKNTQGPVLRFPIREWTAFLSHTAVRPPTGN
ncbi:DUF397 domain-containing protein [Streptomyces carminius]|uniref:DUF397 domain-containing protein n=1 Tax=Streptomyces carminius TaxID=2665496 RepID=A0A2M8LV64_9ACTN|nr:DUF397 domain-containing protein [Streptomyces carminius]PJE95825.1 DUF397 domain-containing protein [Streptomyces carminius]